MASGLIASIAWVACGPAPAPGSDAGGRWACPAGWVAAASGGCGPALWLCAADGGAEGGACDGVAIDRPTPVATDDGGVGSTLYVLPDGAIGGAWPQPGADGGPPAADWTPDAGIASCPTAAGWTRASDGTCDPVVPTDCPANSAPLPGGRCTPTAVSDCPATPFADVGSEATDPVYVLAGADATIADGTAAHPDATIAAGVARAGAGGWVLVGAGTYAEALAVVADVHVVGVCPARAIVQSGHGQYAFDVGAPARQFELRGVGIAGGTGVVVRAGVAATLATLVARGVEHKAVLVQGTGATLSLSLSLIDGTLPVPGAEAFGVDALQGAHATAHDVAVLNTQGIAFDSDNSAALSVADSYVLGAASAAVGGEGVFVNGRASADVRRTVLDRNTGAGLVAVGFGTMATLADVVIRNTREIPGASAGNGVGSGLAAQDGGTIVADRVLIDHTVGFGVRAYTEPDTTPCTVTLRGSVVRDTRSFADGSYGMGVSGSIDRGTITLANVLIDGSHEAGIGLSGPYHATVTDTLVRGTRPNGTGAFGWGIEADYGGVLDLARVRIESSTQIGLAATTGGDTMVRVVDSVIAQDAVPTAATASGVQVQCHAQFDGARVRVTGAVGSGVFAGDGCPEIDDPQDVMPGLTTLGLRDSIIENTRAVDASTVATTALVAESGAVVTVARCAVRANTGFGVVAVNPGTQLVWTDGAIEDTRTAGGLYGTAMAADDHASVTVARTYLHGAAEIGALAIDSAAMDLTDVLIDTVRASSRGYGVGVSAAVGGVVTGQRVSVSNVAGAGLVAVAADGTRAGATPAVAQLTLVDAFVRVVQYSTFGADGAAVAYGLHAADGSTLDVTRVLVDAAGYGFYDANATLAVHSGVIVRQANAFGARTGTTPTLDDVLSAQNAIATVVVDPTLPSSAGLALPPLPPGCTPQSCM